MEAEVDRFDDRGFHVVVLGRPSEQRFEPRVGHLGLVDVAVTYEAVEQVGIARAW
jgi:hypothetical protein